MFTIDRSTESGWKRAISQDPQAKMNMTDLPEVPFAHLGAASHPPRLQHHEILGRQ
jgi:hypothetical protein